jgi:hypothetical protein
MQTQIPFKEKLAQAEIFSPTWLAITACNGDYILPSYEDESIGLTFVSQFL